MYSNFTKVSIQQFNITYVASSGLGTPDGYLDLFGPAI